MKKHKPACNLITKEIISLESQEIDALTLLANVKCETIGCDDCPLKITRLNNVAASICLRGLCEAVLDGANIKYEKS